MRVCLIRIKTSPFSFAAGFLLVISARLIGTHDRSRNASPNARRSTSARARRQRALSQDARSGAAIDRRGRAIGPSARARDGGGDRLAVGGPRRRARARNRPGDPVADRDRASLRSGSFWSSTIRASAACWRGASEVCASFRATPMTCPDARGFRRRADRRPGLQLASAQPAAASPHETDCRRLRAHGTAGSVRAVHLWPAVAHSPRLLRESLFRQSLEADPAQSAAGLCVDLSARYDERRSCRGPVK